MSASQLLSGTPAGVAIMQVDTGLVRSVGPGQLVLEATDATNGYVQLDPTVNVSFSGGPLTAAGAGYINITADASARQTAGAAAGTFTLQKNLVGAINVTNYLQISVAGVPYWIPLVPSNPQTT